MHIKHVLFFHILAIIIPTDYLFQRGWNHQPDIYLYFSLKQKDHGMALFHGKEWLWPGWGTAGLASSASVCLPTSLRSLENTVGTWISLGLHHRNAVAEVCFYFFGGLLYDLIEDLNEYEIWIIWLQWLVPQIRSSAFDMSTNDLKIHAGNPQNILSLILQKNAPGYCALRWRESPFLGMNALME